MYSKNGIDNGLKKSRKQNCKYTVFKIYDFDKDYFIKELTKMSKNDRITKHNSHMIFINNKGVSVLLTWKDVKENKLGELLKKM